MSEAGRQIEKDYDAGLYADVEEGMMNFPYVDSKYIDCDCDGEMTVVGAYNYLKLCLIILAEKMSEEELMDFTITSAQIMGFCSLVAALWGIWLIVKEIKKPGSDLKKKVEEHDRLLNCDNNRLREIEESNRMMLQSLLVIINHNITGNGIEKMKETRDQLQEFLINK